MRVFIVTVVLVLATWTAPFVPVPASPAVSPLETTATVCTPTAVIAPVPQTDDLPAGWEPWGTEFVDRLATDAEAWETSSTP
jgi:hypothetical protein